jgi:hypothetical protein
VRRDQVQLGAAELMAYGHYGRALLVFSSEAGRAGHELDIWAP